MISRLDFFRAILPGDYAETVVNAAPVVIKSVIETAVSEVCGYTDTMYNTSILRNIQFTNEDNELIEIPGDILISCSVDNYVYFAEFDQETGLFVKWLVFLCILDTGGPVALTDTNYFVPKPSDIRFPKLVSVCVDVAIYHLCTITTPSTVPIVRRVRYDGDGNKNNSECAIKWLEKVQRGTIHVPLQLKVDGDGVQETSDIAVLLDEETDTAANYDIF